MANEVLINLLDWCKRERENLQCQLDALKAGRFKTHSNDGRGWKDTTQDSIERVDIWELSNALGQSQTFDNVCITSAFPLMATKSRTSHHVGDGPKADIAPAFLTAEDFAT